MHETEEREPPSKTSPCLKACGALLVLGLVMAGTVFTMGGEPPTDAKVRAVHKSGARHIANYHCSGIGAIGYFCSTPIDYNDQHFCAPHLAMIPYPRTVPGTDIEVNAFNMTSLMPTATKPFRAKGI